MNFIIGCILNLLFGLRLVLHFPNLLRTCFMCPLQDAMSIAIIKPTVREMNTIAAVEPRILWLRSLSDSVNAGPSLFAAFILFIVKDGSEK